MILKVNFPPIKLNLLPDTHFEDFEYLMILTPDTGENITFPYLYSHVKVSATYPMKPFILIKGAIFLAAINIC